MNSENFAFWLQGYFELLDEDKPLTVAQARMIKEHLALVFEKVTTASSKPSIEKREEKTDPDGSAKSKKGKKATAPPKISKEKQAEIEKMMSDLIERNKTLPRNVWPRPMCYDRGTRYC